MGKFTIQMAEVCNASFFLKYVTKIRCDAYVSMTYRNSFFSLLKWLEKLSCGMVFFTSKMSEKIYNSTSTVKISGLSTYIENTIEFWNTSKHMIWRVFLKIPQLYY